jgi:hypothetical protein
MLNLNQSDVEESFDAGESKEEPFNDTTADASANSDVASATGHAALSRAVQLYSQKLFLPFLNDHTTLQELHQAYQDGVVFLPSTTPIQTYLNSVREEYSMSHKLITFAVANNSFQKG